MRKIITSSLPKNSSGFWKYSVVSATERLEGLPFLETCMTCHKPRHWHHIIKFNQFSNKTDFHWWMFSLALTHSCSPGVEAFKVLTVSPHHALVHGTEIKHLGLNLEKSSYVFYAIKEKHENKKGYLISECIGIFSIWVCKWKHNRDIKTLEQIVDTCQTFFPAESYVTKCVVMKILPNP